MATDQARRKIQGEADAERVRADPQAKRKSALLAKVNRHAGMRSLATCLTPVELKSAEAAATLLRENQDSRTILQLVKLGLTIPKHDAERAPIDLTPGVLTPQQAKELLATARRLHGGQLVAYTAIGLFAGLRPARAGHESLRGRHAVETPLDRCLNEAEYTFEAAWRKTLAPFSTHPRAAARIKIPISNKNA